MDRRAFLRLTGLATIPVAVPVLSSCTRKPKVAAETPTGSAAPSPSSSSSSSSSPSGAPQSLQSLVNANTGRLEVGFGQGELLVNSGRLAIGLTKDNKPVTDAAVTIYIGQNPDEPPVASARGSWIQGEMAPRALYVADINFPKAGEWLVGVTARLKDGTIYGGGATTVPPVTDKSTMPTTGQPAISVATPTVADPLGADPLCSATPPCPMHAVSLDAALKSGKPTVFTIAAPLYCQTETCGPVVHLVEAAMPSYAARYNFVHVEAYDKDSVGTLQPWAQAWGLKSEPLLFFIGADGLVKDRLDGAFGEDELATRLQALNT